MRTRQPRFSLKPLPPTEEWNELSQSQRDLWIDFATGQQFPWLDFQTRNRTGQEVWAQSASILSALENTPTSPATLPEQPVWQSRIIYATEFTVIAGLEFQWETRALPTDDTDYFVFATAPALTAQTLNTAYMPFIESFRLGSGGPEPQPTRNLISFYEEKFGSLATHIGEYILAIIFQSSGAACRYDLTSLTTVAAE